ncbi:MAG: class IV adenylate cyclase [Candidatus Hodarchaeota archaeon]
MIEVEIKVRIPDPALMRRKFEENKGSYKFSLLHEDTYYNMPKGLRDFKQTDEALRLRKSSRFDKTNREKNQDLEYYITYKGKKIDNLTKTRKEIDIKIEDIKKMKKILETLGFQEVFTVKKERELYEFDFGNYHIEALIDYIPILEQYFIEVEYLSNSKVKISESKELLFNFLSSFGIQKENFITKSYLELILEHFESS